MDGYINASKDNMNDEEDIVLNKFTENDNAVFKEALAIDKPSALNKLSQFFNNNSDEDWNEDDLSDFNRFLENLFRKGEADALNEFEKKEDAKFLKVLVIKTIFKKRKRIFLMILTIP